MKEREYHALLTVYGLGNMDKRLTKRLVSWLRMQADAIEKDGAKAYTEGRFTARLSK